MNVLLGNIDRGTYRRYRPILCYVIGVIEGPIKLLFLKDVVQFRDETGLNFFPRDPTFLYDEIALGFLLMIFVRWHSTRAYHKVFVALAYVLVMQALRLWRYDFAPAWEAVFNLVLTIFAFVVGSAPDWERAWRRARRDMRLR